MNGFHRLLYLVHISFFCFPMLRSRRGRQKYLISWKKHANLLLVITLRFIFVVVFTSFFHVIKRDVGTHERTSWWWTTAGSRRDLRRNLSILPGQFEMILVDLFLGGRFLLPQPLRLQQWRRIEGTEIIQISNSYFRFFPIIAYIESQMFYLSLGTSSVDNWGDDDLFFHSLWCLRPSYSSTNRWKNRGFFYDR